MPQHVHSRRLSWLRRVTATPAFARVVERGNKKYKWECGTAPRAVARYQAIREYV